jgi:hypothetical protein
MIMTTANNSSARHSPHRPGAMCVIRVGPFGARSLQITIQTKFDTESTAPWSEVKLTDVDKALRTVEKFLRAYVDHDADIADEPGSTINQS